MARSGSAKLRWLLALAAAAGLALGAGSVAFYSAFLRDLPNFESLADYQPDLSTRILDSEGRLVGEFYRHRRQLTPLDQVPRILIQAFLAAEDASFYQHGGVDYRSILRAAWANLRAGGETVQGASTITQQMVKQLLLSPERTYRRKIRELILARRIEKRFSKDEILYLYLNQIYFGSGAYGIGEAAHTYFGKEPSQLSLGEAALLAGLPKAPGRNSPFRNPARAEQRRRYVLQRMLDEGFIGPEQYQQARDHPPDLVRTDREPFEVAAYFTEEVRRALVARLGSEAVLHGGLVVETPMDLELQRAAVEAVRSGLRALDRRRGWRGPVRTVSRAALAEELERLAQENGLRSADDPREQLLSGGARLGLVTEVDARAGRAQVAFAPGLEAQLRLEDVAWAHPVDPTRRFRPMKDLSQILSVGDVARMEVHADPEGLRATLFQEPEVQGALLSFDVQSGDLLALVGGYDFAKSEFDRATQARRQPGSAFKPIVYATALVAGHTPADIVYDRPTVYVDEATGDEWRPENYGHHFYGRLTLIEALARSVNNAAIHVAQQVGVDKVIALARRIGIRSPLERNLGIALGVNPLTLLELTRAYAVFANGGVLRQPRLISRVLDRNGQVILEDVPLADYGESPPPAPAETPDGLQEPPQPAAAPVQAAAGEPAAELLEGRVLPPTQAYLAGSLLRDVVLHPHGTGRRARALHRPVGGKTGTTNDNGDAWFVGFSPDIATGVWVGYDERRLLGRGETGGRAALPIWLRYMKAALATRPDHDFDVPDGIVFARIDAHTGLLASPDSKVSLFQAFLEGTEPSQRADAALTATESRRRLRLDF